MKIARAVAAAIPALVLCVTASQAQRTSSCPITSIAIDKPTMRPGAGGYLHLTGILRHSCPVPIGVQLKWTTYDSSGAVVFSVDFWPASIRNIPPNTDYAFDIPQKPPVTPSRFTVSAIATTIW